MGYATFATLGASDEGFVKALQRQASRSAVGAVGRVIDNIAAPRAAAQFVPVPQPIAAPFPWKKYAAVGGVVLAAGALAFMLRK